ncbi:SDR family NAD(P)-dependent oxidoreductase [Palleronia sediminis]|uniref:SDR family NAD(P)-dependent oxidoreductase n=1 Tax=Palleronia sediminis TaxID=2547833 RepID=A0A4R6ALV0_9RHOB|nr:SDR family NAD(P)-dependent oxidoreductase [Palleronia sediminis]
MPDVKTGAGRGKGRDAAVASSFGELRLKIQGKDPAAVAVLGYACRLPGADSVAEAWDVLREGRCTVSEIPEDRWTSLRYLDPSGANRGRSLVRAAGIVEDVWSFDANLFGISPREAEGMDPQQRMMLEVAHRAMDHAGVDPHALEPARVGVYVGASNPDHMTIAMLDPRRIDAFSGLGNTLSLLSNRISYHWNFHGPSYTVDTACSSAMVALDRARRDIADELIDTAIVGGVNALLSPMAFVAFSAAGMLSPRGLCRAFAEDPDGYVRAEGAVAFVLQREDVARAAGRRVRSILAGTGVSTDGRTVGVAVPSERRQADLVASVLAAARVAPDELAFAEAHGTGTAVGDPREALSLGRSVGMQRDRPLPIGSAKSNFGHLEPAAGLLGLLKCQLALEHGLLPATLHAETPNPEIDFAGLNLSVAQAPIEIAARGRPWAGLVNSFGFGGANATAVLTQPGAQPVAAGRVPMPPALMLSAGSPASLERLARAWRDRAATVPEGLAGAVAGANRHIGRLRHRLVAPAGDADALGVALTGWLDGESGPRAPVRRAEAVGRDAPVAFVFCGNGAVHEGMAREIYEGDPIFAATIAEIADLAGPIEGRGLVDHLCAPEDGAYRGGLVAQSLLFAVQMGLVEAMAARGLRPGAVLGHSAGEIAAATVAGHLSRDEALGLIRTRCASVEALRGQGGMAALGVGRAAAQGLIDRLGLALEIGAENAPDNVTLTGPVPALETALRRARADGIAGKLLAMDYPYHSRLLDPSEAMFMAGLPAFGQTPPRAADAPAFVSGWQGAMAVEPLRGAYWWGNTRNPVAFRDGMQTLIDQGYRIAVEIGPRPVLQRDMRDCFAAQGERAAVIATLREGAGGPSDAVSFVRSALAAGGRVDEDVVLGPARPFTGDLPDYPFDRQLYHHLSPGMLLLPGRADDHPFLGWQDRQDDLHWTGSLSLARMPWLADHVVQGEVWLPGTAILVALTEAGRRALGRDRVELRNLEILQSVRLEPAREQATRVTWEPGARRLTFSVETQGGWSLVAVASVWTLADPAPPPLVLAEGDQDAAPIYDALCRAGLNFGPAFRLLDRGHVDGDTCDAWLGADAPETAERRMAVLDALLHAVSPLLEGTDLIVDRPTVPRRYGRVRQFSDAMPRAIRIRLLSVWEDGLCADASLVDAEGRVVLTIEELRGQVLGRGDAALRDLWDEVEIPCAGQAAPVLGPAVAESRAPADAPPGDLAILRRAIGHRMAWDRLTGALSGQGDADGAAGVALDLLMSVGAARMDADGMPELAQTPPWPDLDTLAHLLARQEPGAALELRAALDRPGDATAARPAPDRRLAQRAARLLRAVGEAPPRWIVLAGDVSVALLAAAQGLGAHVTVAAPDAGALDLLRGRLHGAQGVRFATLDALAGRADLLVGVDLARGWAVDAAERLAALVAPGGEILTLDEAPDAFALMTGRHGSAGSVDRLAAGIARAGLTLDLGADRDNGAILIGHGVAPEAPRSAPPAFEISGTGPLAEALGRDGTGDPVARVAVVPGTAGVAAALERARAFLAETPPDRPAWIVAECDAVVAAELTGWRRVAVNELGRDLRVASVAPGGDPSLLRRAMAEGREHEIRVEGATCTTPRAIPLPDAPDGHEARRLVVARRSAALDGLRWRAIPRRAPAPHEVEIAVAATGLNFRDVMWAQGLLPQDALEGGAAGTALGLECAGVVLRAGDASGFAPGDRVMALGAHGFASHVTLPADSCGRLPEWLDFEQAAGIPVVFQTADYALRDVARLAPGETVLIHGAAGGVGLAAIQIAQAIGARILATAGSPAKRRYLSGLGVAQVFDSRSLAFERAVKEATDGAGVDVVLNALAGEAMERSIACLAPFGRFLELGKRDFVADTPIGLRALRRNISYHAIDLDQLAALRPERVRRVMERVCAGFVEGSLTPLPVEVFPAEDAETAFRHMQRAGHLGKLVIRAPEPPPGNPARPEARALAGRWLIVGGTQGFGLATAEWLAAQGPCELWLASRGGRIDEAGRARLAQAGARVHAVSLDVTDRDAVAALGTRIATQAGPLDGIVHAAMVLHDGILATLDDAAMAPVLRAKLDGAEALAALADAQDVGHFWLYASVAGRFGNPGQAPYAAANRALEAMARTRRDAGKPALAVAWGPIGDTGYLSRTPDVAKHADRLGPLMSARDALDRLGGVLATRPDLATVTIAPASWGRVAKGLGVLRGPLFDLVDMRGGAAGEATLDLAAMVAGMGETAARKAVLDMLVIETARILHMTPEEIDPLRPLEEMGFDSLLAMSLKLTIEDRIGAPLSGSGMRAGLNLTHLVRALFEGARGDGALAEEAAFVGRNVVADEVDERQRAAILDEVETAVDLYAETD